MAFFSYTRTQRNTAFAVLLVWLFALASGVANACLLEARVTHGQAATAGASETAHAHAELAGHAGAVADRDGDREAFNAPCLKVCDDGSQSLLKQQSSVDLTDPGLALLVAVVWTAIPVGSAPGRMDDMQPTTLELPIRIRYSRLTL